ncbi:MAG: hypothetical protein E7L17_12590 [Clostridium sp.]|uniref:hypothetical protein n=1 Tax=Clostridium sp. TaxID=1506 RepID=UPI00290AFB30|nr:hypothetical protein [Clostridium sp.]MDU7338941.1 hypothetical protein [Clostridium sp.]
MNAEQNEKNQENAAEHGELPEELVEEIDFDRFAESKKSEENQVSTDYRSAYQKKSDKKKKSSKRSPEEKKVRAALEAAEQARLKAQKVAADFAQAAQAPDPEPEPELDDFLPEGESAEHDDILLIKKATLTPEEQEQAEAENTDETAVIVAEQTPSLRRRGKYRYGIGVGALVMVLAFVGLSVLVWGVGRQIYRAATDDTQLRAYDTFLSPIVMQDPEPFENEEEANAEMVMKASLWRAVTQNGAQYNSYDDQGRTLVPLGDVVDACHALFGPNCNLQPSNPKEETFFEYDSQQNVFRVAPYSSQSSFAPYTISSKKSGDTVTLRVGYVVGDWQDATESSSASPEPVKYMQYILKKTADGKSEYVAAVRAEKAS